MFISSFVLDMIGMVAAPEHGYDFYLRENVLDSGLMPAGIVSQPHFRSADLPIVFILAPTAGIGRNVYHTIEKSCQAIALG